MSPKIFRVGGTLVVFNPPPPPPRKIIGKMFGTHPPPPDLTLNLTPDRTPPPPKNSKIQNSWTPPRIQKFRTRDPPPPMDRHTKSKHNLRRTTQAGGKNVAANWDSVNKVTFYRVNKQGSTSQQLHIFMIIVRFPLKRK